MNNIRSLLGSIMDNLDRSAALSELNPKSSGKYISLTCPSCGQNTAYISNSGYYIYCNRKNKCGYVGGLVDYISQRDGISEEESIVKLADVADIAIPDTNIVNNEEYQLIKNKELLYKDIMKIGKYGIWLKQSQNVRQYLNDRGYSDSDIIMMNFGYLPPISELRKKLIELNHSPILIDDSLLSFDSSHPLLIPILNPYGYVDGFATRAIDNTVSPKYLYSRGLERGTYFLNISDAKKSETLIIVEGVIDALLLKQRGIDGVVACGGDSPTVKQIEHAFTNYKFKRVILSLDSDEAGIKGNLRAINLLLKYTDSIFVANTSPYKDPDEFLTNNTIDALADIFSNAPKWINWSANNILSNNDINTDIGRDNALNLLVELQYHTTNPIDKDYLINFIANSLSIPLPLVNDKIQSYNDVLNRKIQLDSYKSIISKAFQYYKQGKIELLDNHFQDALTNVKSSSIVSNIQPYSFDEALIDIQKRQNGLNTGYSSIDNFITIPNGAVTLVAGRPSHGKTTFLLNLYYNMIELYPDKSFLFFSYEESKTALFVKLINLMSETIISESAKNKNTQQIEYYIKGGIKDLSPTYESGRPNPYYNINQSIDKYREMVSQNRLWLVDIPLDVLTLSSITANMCSKHDIGGIFIDYAQRIKYSGSYDTERIKIARISELLREIATKYDIPFIVGAQLNRENAKLKPQLDNLKEAGNLEEDANVVLGLYNWKTAIDKDKADMDPNRKNCYGTNISIDDRNIDFEVHILKNRNGSINESALLSFDAPILKIKDSEIREESPF